jgi:hypothetical protein
MWVKPLCACLLAALLTGLALGAPVPALLDRATQEKVQSLLKERRDVLGEVVKAREAQFKAGRLTPDVLAEAHRALLAAELELTTDRAERVKLCEGLAQRSRDYESHMKAAFDAGRITPGDLTAATAEARADVVRLLRERAGPRPTEKQAAELRKLRHEHRELLAKAFEVRQKVFVEEGLGRQEVMSKTARLKLEADLEFASHPSERIAAHRAHFAGAQHRSNVLQEGFEAGRVTRFGRDMARAEKLTAEVGLLRAKGKLNSDEADRLQALQRDRRAHWAEAFKGAMAQWEYRPGPLDIPLDISAHLLEADLDAAETQTGRVAAHRAQISRLRKIEELAKAAHDVGRLTAPDYLNAKAARLAAEVAFLRAGGKPAELGK